MTWAAATRANLHGGLPVEGIGAFGIHDCEFRLQIRELDFLRLRMPRAA